MPTNLGWATLWKNHIYLREICVWLYSHAEHENILIRIEAHYTWEELKQKCCPNSDVGKSGICNYLNSQLPSSRIGESLAWTVMKNKLSRYSFHKQRQGEDQVQEHNLKQTSSKGPLKQNTKWITGHLCAKAILSSRKKCFWCMWH